MKLGIGSYTYPWAVGVQGYYPEKRIGVFDILDKAIELGIKVVQIADNLPLDRLSNAEIESIRKFTSALNIEVEIGTRGIQNDNLLTYLDLAKRLNSSIVRVVIDTADHHPEEDEIIWTIKSVMPDFERLGIKLAIENHDRLSVITFEQIIKKINSEYIGICLDTANSFGSLEGPEFVVERLGKLAVNLHIKDFKIYRAEHNLGFIIEGTPAGKGMLKIPWILQKIKEYGRNINAILELWTPPELDIAETIEKENNWAKTSIRYLRSFIRD
ncbi:MAG: sugar phosphate isomerase/epimerase family protein [Candidatus Poribacteria bacterium]